MQEPHSQTPNHTDPQASSHITQAESTQIDSTQTESTQTSSQIHTDNSANSHTQTNHADTSTHTPHQKKLSGSTKIFAWILGIGAVVIIALAITLLFITNSFKHKAQEAINSYLSAAEAEFEPFTCSGMFSISCTSPTLEFSSATFRNVRLDLEKIESKNIRVRASGDLTMFDHLFPIDESFNFLQVMTPTKLDCAISVGLDGDMQTILSNTTQCEYNAPNVSYNLHWQGALNADIEQSSNLKLAYENIAQALETKEEQFLSASTLFLENITLSIKAKNDIAKTIITHNGEKKLNEQEYQEQHKQFIKQIDSIRGVLLYTILLGAKGQDEREVKLVLQGIDGFYGMLLNKHKSFSYTLTPKSSKPIALRTFSGEWNPFDMLDIRYEVEMNESQKLEATPNANDLAQAQSTQQDQTYEPSKDTPNSGSK